MTSTTEVVSRDKEVASQLLLLFLHVEETTGSARIFGTMDELGEMLDPPVPLAAVSSAMRSTRHPDHIRDEKYSFPSLGNGRSGLRHGYVLEYSKADLPIAQGQLDEHGKRLHTALRSLVAQYSLAQRIVDKRRTTEVRAIEMALKAVDLAADALEIGLGLSNNDEDDDGA